jgi:hypothetical protein
LIREKGEKKSQVRRLSAIADYLPCFTYAEIGWNGFPLKIFQVRLLFLGRNIAKNDTLSLFFYDNKNK